MPFKPLSCVYGKLVIPHRYIMVVMVQLALLNSYHLRVVLNIAITEMIQPQEEKEREYDSCPNFVYEKVDVKGGTYDWPTWLRAFILYAFYIGYIFMQLPGGWLADKLGPRHVMGTSMLISIIITYVFPLAIHHGGHIAAIVLRGFLGLAQGSMYPAASSFLQNWAPASERSFMGGIAYSGGNMGAFTGNLFTGIIIDATKSWPMAFYIWATIAALWYIFYLFTVFSHPSTHPFITKEEFDKIHEELEVPSKFAVPWKRIVTTIPIYAILFSHLAHDYTYFTLVTDLPKYMKDILKLNIKDNATFSAIPFLLMAVSNMAFARISDLLIKRGWCRILVVRKLYSFVGNVGPAVCVLMASYVGCNREGAIALYTIGMGLMGIFYSGTMVNINDLTRHYSGIIMACINGLGSLTGIIGPFFVGYLTPNGTLEEWRKVFWIVIALCTLNSCVFVIFAKAERQPWDYPEGDSDEPKEGETK